MSAVLRASAIAEACSWLGLLIGMAFKHSGNGELGVTVFGPIHGVLVMVYVALVVLGARSLGWTTKQTTLALLAAVPPFATLIVERTLLRQRPVEPVPQP